MGELILIFGVVWVTIALLMGGIAAYEDRRTWGWFLGTLFFGGFAIFLYWTTKLYQEKNRANSPHSTSGCIQQDPRPKRLSRRNFSMAEKTDTVNENRAK